MSEARRLWRTLGNLGLALLNATLLLVLACLVVALLLANRVDGIATTMAGAVSDNIVKVAPLREDVQGMTAEIAGLRGDLEAVGTTSGEATTEAITRLTARVDAFETRAAEIRTRVRGVTANPDEWLAQAVGEAARQLTVSLASLAGCVPQPVDPNAPLRALKTIEQKEEKVGTDD